jgi:hypothetical protein
VGEAWNQPDCELAGRLGPRERKALWEVGEDQWKCFPDIIKKVTSETATFLGKISCYKKKDIVDYFSWENG